LTVLDSLDPIRWTFNFPAGAARLESLSFAFEGPTPIERVAVFPYGLPYQLGSYYSWVSTDPHYVLNTGIVGKSLFWPIRPGYAETLLDGPQTFTGSFLYPGSDGTLPQMLIRCDLADAAAVGMSLGGTFSPAVSALSACAATRVARYLGAETDTAWGFRIRKPQTTTQLVRVEWQYNGGAWATIYTPSSPTSAEVLQPITIAMTSAPIPSLISWRAVCTQPSGPNLTGPASPTSDPLGDLTGGPSLTECFGGEYLGSMELTSPKTWLIGLGKMGSCVVRFLFVPDETAEKFDSMVTSLSAQFPFSVAFEFISFMDALGSAIDGASGTGCFDMPGSWSFGAAGSVAVDDVCVGDGLTVGSTQRNLLAVLIVSPLIFSLLVQGVRMVSGGRAAAAPA